MLGDLAPVIVKAFKTLQKAQDLRIAPRRIAVGNGRVFRVLNTSVLRAVVVTRQTVLEEAARANVKAAFGVRLGLGIVVVDARAINAALVAVDLGNGGLSTIFRGTVGGALAVGLAIGL